MNCSICNCRNSRFIAGGIVVGWTLLVSGCERFAIERTPEAANAAALVEPAVLVKLGEFEIGTISRKLPVSADLEAVARAEVPSEVSGVIAEVLRREGDPIHRGDAVLRLEDKSQRLVVETKRILDKQAKGKVKQADIARREGKQMSEQKKLALDQARAVYDRTTQLSAADGPDIISTEEKDEKRVAYEQAQIDFATAALQKDRYEIEYQDANQSAELASVELETAEYELSRRTLVAPIEGVISYLRVKPGEPLAASAHAYTVVDTSRLEARLQVPQRDLPSIRKGLEVAIRTEVYPETETDPIPGEIDVVNEEIDPDTGTLELIASIREVVEPGARRRLLPGLFVTVDIILDTRIDAVLVPKRAVSYVNKEPVIFLVQDGIAHQYTVSPGYSNRDSIEVLGLRAVNGSEADVSDGQLVLIGHNNLKEGTPVEVEADDEFEAR